MRCLFVIVGFCLAASPILFSSVAVAQPAGEEPETPRPRYHDAIAAELTTLRIAHTCEAETRTRTHCTFSYNGTGQGQQEDLTFEIHLIYSDESDTIYLYAKDYVMAPSEAVGTPAVLRRLLELNWELLVGRFEWDPSRGEVRFSMVMNTDSNFDRRAFRSIVRQIGPIADRHHGELSRLSAPE